MKQVDLLKKLKNLSKSYYTIADLQIIFQESRAAARKDVHRLVKQGVLKKIGRNIYLSPFSAYDPERIAADFYAPCYLSFESALAKYGISSQIPYTITFATPRRSKKITLGNQEVEYKRVKLGLFFGYKLAKGLPIAEPEKTLLDQLYMVSLGKAKLDFEELDLHELSFRKAEKMARKFPKAVQKKLLELKPRWKEIPVTI